MKHRGIQNLDQAPAEREADLAETTRVAERSVLAAVLMDPEALPTAIKHVSPDDFSDPALGLILAALIRLSASGAEYTLPRIVDYLAQRDQLEPIGGAQRLVDLADEAATSAIVEHDARLVRRLSLEREARPLCQRLAESPRDAGTLARVAEIQAECAQLDAPSLDLRAIGFTGDRLRALSGRERAVSPLPGLIDPEAHLHVVQGRQKTGKTTLLLALARTWAEGQAPWPGAEPLPRSDVLVISREQPATRLHEILARLAHFGARDATGDGWRGGITLIARDPDLAPAGRSLLELGDIGLSALRAALLAAGRAGRPFGLVILDSLSRLKPSSVEENDNDAMTRWLDRLEEIAVECGVYVFLTHHVGHASEGIRSEARSAGRRASAIGAVAQVLWLVERAPDNPRHRIVKVDGNAILPHEIRFEVAPHDAEAGEIRGLRPVEAAELLERYELPALIGAREEISTTELARRLSAMHDPGWKRSEPSGQHHRTASQLREHWAAAGLVDVRDGPRNAKLIARRARRETERSTAPRARQGNAEESSESDPSTAPIEARGCGGVAEPSPITEPSEFRGAVCPVAGADDTDEGGGREGTP